LFVFYNIAFILSLSLFLTFHFYLIPNSKHFHNPFLSLKKTFKTTFFILLVCSSFHFFDFLSIFSKFHHNFFVNLSSSTSHLPLLQRLKPCSQSCSSSWHKFLLFFFCFFFCFSSSHSLPASSRLILSFSKLISVGPVCLPALSLSLSLSLSPRFRSRRQKPQAKDVFFAQSVLISSQSLSASSRSIFPPKPIFDYDCYEFDLVIYCNISLL
jgi:hypothetical protein